MSDFKVVFKLKQHTPLIHFQSEQPAATLRASELKPKLDRFLIKYAFQENEKSYSKFLIEEGKQALDYKVEIVALGTEVSDIRNKTYFANLGKKSHETEYRREVTAKQILITVFSYNKELVKLIKKYFVAFMATENFGTRQSKGFGSFYLTPEDTSYVDIFTALNQTKQHYIFARYRGVKSSKIFSYVEVVYPLIKTGINYPNHPEKINKKGRSVPDVRGGRGENASYYRSFLFRYMHEKYNIGNEKRFIKENFFGREKIEKDNNEKYYVRALLGISDGVTFRDKRWGKISYEGNGIARYKSPLTFKIVDDYMIIIANSPDVILNKKFIFSDEDKNQQNISTPKRFDMNDFIDNFADYFNNLQPTNKNFFDKKIIEAKKTTFKKVSE